MYEGLNPEPVTAEPHVLTAEQMQSLVFVHLSRASHDPVTKPSYSRDFLLDNLPQTMDQHQVAALSLEMFALAYNTSSIKAKARLKNPGEYPSSLTELGETSDLHRSERKDYSAEAIRQSNSSRRRILGWLGELCCHTGDITTARNTVMELRHLGGLRNRRAARSLQRTIGRAEYLPALLYKRQ